MHEHGVHRLREALAEVWDSGGRRFVTIEDGHDEDVFVQYIDGQLNVSWPFEADPNTELPRLGAPLPGGVFVISWAPRGTVILAVGDLLLDDVADLVDRILDRVLEAGDPTARVHADR